MDSDTGEASNFIWSQNERLDPQDQFFNCNVSRKMGQLWRAFFVFKLKCPNSIIISNWKYHPNATFLQIESIFHLLQAYLYIFDSVSQV